MHRLFAALARAAALLVLVATAVRGASAQRADLERIIQRRVLENGLEVIVVENHGVPLVTVEFDVRNGSFTQSPEFAGLAHMYEHMFFRANRSYPEPDRFIDQLGRVGAVFNGTTSEERVNYYLTAPADKLAESMQLMASALRSPLFLQEELERERVVVLGEYDRNESSPFFALTRGMDARLWPGVESRKNTIGDRQIIRSTTREQMREIQSRYYVPNNTAMIVTGDVTPDSVFALARRHLGDWPRAADPFVAHPIPAIVPLARNDAVIVEQPIGVVAVLLQWHGPSVGKDPEATYAADVFSDLVNQPGSSFQRRLVDSGLFQSATINYYTLNHVGPISILGQTTPEKLREAMVALENEIARFGEPNYFSRAELEGVKQQRIVTSAFGRERASGLAQTIGFWWSVASLEYYMGYVDNMARQTTADLKAYADKYIVGKPRVIGILLSAEARRNLGLTEQELVASRPAR